MIIVDVFVPVVNKEYDFSINEKSQISLVIEELSEMIAQKEGFLTVKHPENFILCNAETKGIMDIKLTLESYGIGNGGRLIMI